MEKAKIEAPKWLRLEKINSIIEILFLIALGAYLFVAASGVTVFYFEYPENTEQTLLIILSLIVMVKTLLGKKDYYVLAAFFFAFFFYLSYRSVGYRFLLFIAVIMIGSANVNYKKILKTYLISTAPIIILGVLSCLSGALHNLVYLTETKELRSSWGMCYTTDFASIFLFMLMAAFVLLTNIPELFFLPIVLLYMFIPVYVAKSTTSTICGCLLIATVLIMWMVRLIRRKKTNIKGYSRLVDMMMVMAFPVMAAIIFVVIYIGWYGDISFLNVIMNGRVELVMNAVEKYGIKPFGTDFILIGNGASTIQDTGYNFVDPSYALIMIRYGWVVLMVVAAMWVYMTIRAIMAGNRRMAAVMAIIAVHSLSEHHFLEINYNIILILTFALLGNKDSNNTPSISEFIGTGDEKKKKIIKLTVWTGGLVVFWLFMPLLFSVLRTIFHGYYHIEDGDAFMVIGIWVGIFSTAFLLLYSLVKLLSELIIYKRLMKLNAVIAVLAFVIIVVSAIKACIVIQNFTDDNVDQFAEGIEVVDIAGENLSGRLYVDRFPESYSKCGVPVSRSIFNGEDLARFDNVTFVADKELDSDCFINRGFLYLPFSEKSALYTNDESVINALKNNGYHLTGYCTNVFTIDLEEEAELNDLKIKDNGIILDTWLHSLMYGPYVDLADGDYTATYSLKVDAVPYESDYEVAILRINTYWGQRTIAEKTIYRSSFDENGELLVELPFRISSGRAVEFLAFAFADQRLEVKNIEYARTPAYDTHIRVDELGRIVHEEYYDLGGRPIASQYGAFGMDYGYDKDDNRTFLRFLGEDGEPFISSYGCASLRRVFEDGHIINESYYDVMGLPLQMIAGYYAISQKWDGDLLIERTYLDIEGKPVERIDGYSKAVWEQTNGTWNVSFYDLSNNEISSEGINLARNIRYEDDGWTEWIAPTYNLINSCQDIGYVNLGSKTNGDIYSCYIEIEFKNVTATDGGQFFFWTQGASDGKWIVRNVWNPSLIKLDEIPEDGVYICKSTVVIDEDMTHISKFNIGFRCDYWASGCFRVRNVKIEKGETATEWTPEI